MFCCCIYPVTGDPSASQSSTCVECANFGQLPPCLIRGDVKRPPSAPPPPGGPHFFCIVAGIGQLDIGLELVATNAPFFFYQIHNSKLSFSYRLFLSTYLPHSLSLTLSMTLFFLSYTQFYIKNIPYRWPSPLVDDLFLRCFDTTLSMMGLHCQQRGHQAPIVPIAAYSLLWPPIDFLSRLWMTT